MRSFINNPEHTPQRTHTRNPVNSNYEILTSDARDLEEIRAAMEVLDLAGVGPHSSQDLSVKPLLVEQWAAELEALGPPSESDSDSA